MKICLENHYTFSKPENQQKFVMKSNIRDTENMSTESQIKKEKTKMFFAWFWTSAPLHNHNGKNVWQSPLNAENIQIIFP